ncbi:uncharacterized protein B0H18DRAFT_1029913 [Fomitopsis serialis]|uniref:uncharacterized protein n=1 Tax=Fomitopsis serialis TaxID=139415 RepID=UPI002007BA65|nr:uncharacterized protein B0H18DRAFT_1029913 [Neoantrodia serialis]KAH9918856.1 hypothetical protein B0H18DRAFT_1029913 [Neoantrodia serialis]
MTGPAADPVEEVAVINCCFVEEQDELELARLTTCRVMMRETEEEGAISRDRGIGTGVDSTSACSACVHPAYHTPVRFDPVRRRRQPRHWVSSYYITHTIRATCLAEGCRICPASTMASSSLVSKARGSRYA